MRIHALVPIVATALCAADLVAPSASAQQVRLVPEGDTVRVWAPGFRLRKTTTTVLGWTDRTVLLVRLSPPPDSLTLPFSGVTRLDVLRGKDRGRGLLNGAGIGGGVGLLAGVLVGQATVSGCTEFLCELNALNYAMGGMLIGAGLGAVVGSASPPDRWERVELPTAAGFPPYRRPFHETFAFKLISAAVGIAVTALIAN